MRLVMLRTGGGGTPGAVVAVGGVDRVVTLDGAGDVVRVLTDPGSRRRAETMVADALAGDTGGLPALADLDLDAPVRPPAIVCIGYNYRGHVPDGEDPTRDDPDFPDVFVKTANTISAPRDEVVLPATAIDPDYEGEIAFVVGRRATRVPLDEAASYIAGYTLLDDVTDRAWQRRQSQWAMGKCFDGSAPIGPVVVTADEIADPVDLLVEVVRDGVVTCRQSTADMVFPFPFLLHHLSQVMTLEPGAVVTTGAPQKLGTAQDVHRPLADGDAVTIRVAGLGELTTVFRTTGGTA